MNKLPQPRWYRRSVGDSLDHLEVLVAKLGDGIKADVILFEMDEVRARLDAVAAQGKTAIGEEAQFEYIGILLKKKLPDFFRDAGGTAALMPLRSTRQPNRKAWWWFLDEIYAAQLKSARKKKLIWLGSAAAVLMLLFVGYLLFPPSPATLTSMSYTSEIQNDLVTGDFTGALAHANQGLVAMPGNVTFLIMKGIAQTRLGEIVDGTQSFVMAEVSVNDPESYLLQRALIYLRIGDWISVLNDAQVVVKLDPQSAEGFFLLGTAYDNLHQMQKAYNAFVDAERLANAQRNYPLLSAIQMNRMYLLPYIDEGTKQVLPTPGPLK